MRRRVKNVHYSDEDDCTLSDTLLISVTDYDDDDYDYEDDDMRVRTKAAQPSPLGSSVSPAAVKQQTAPQQQKEKPTPPPKRHVEPVVAADTRQSLNLVVIGHVDAGKSVHQLTHNYSGKSTLMGHLLCQLGVISDSMLNKSVPTRFRQESKNVGRESFVFAWALDEGEDERERGITIDVCVKQFQTASKNISVFDAPGHREFVPNMLLAAVQADAALLVVDAKNFNSGFCAGGQTKEHIQLVRSLGISKLLVAINKLDAVSWEESVYQYIKQDLLAFITGPDVRYKMDAVEFVPVSAFSGVNLTRSSAACDELKRWWEGPNLEEMIDGLQIRRVGLATSTLTCVLSDVWAMRLLAEVSAKVETGSIRKDQKVLILPSRQTAKVTSLECRGKVVNQCNAGDFVEKICLNIDRQHVHIGSVICDSSHSLPVVSEVFVKLVVFDIDTPILPGTQPAQVTQLLATYNKATNDKVPRRPRILVRGDIALLKLQLAGPTCVEYYKKSVGTAALCRVILRHKGSTIAAGMIIDPISV